MKNKYMVPYHMYEITLSNGEVKYVDVANEDDWRRIDLMWRDVGFGDMIECVGFFNDEDLQIEIVNVVDCENGTHYNPLDWAENHVWVFDDNYFR